MDPKPLQFKIDAFSPATIPMARLAEYMAELAELLGQKEHVHFSELSEGSTVIEHVVDYEAYPSVHDRLREAHSPVADPEIHRHVVALNSMLSKDNASGQLTGEGMRILRFPGARQKLPEPIGPIKQHYVAEGELVRIGGRDKSAHAAIMTVEGNIVKTEIDRGLAKSLAKHLYSYVRVEGTSRWIRQSSGEWELLNFKITSFEVLKDRSLRESIDELRQTVGSKLLEGVDNKLDYLKQIRDHESN